MSTWVQLCLAKSTLEDGYCSSSSVGAAAGHPAETGTRQKEILGAGTSACLVRWAELHHSHLLSIPLRCRSLNKILTAFPLRFLSPPCESGERSTSLNSLLARSWSKYPRGPADVSWESLTPQISSQYSSLCGFQNSWGPHRFFGAKVWDWWSINSEKIRSLTRLFKTFLEFYVSLTKKNIKITLAF